MTKDHKMSSAFEQFKSSYFEHPNREGPDLEILDKLNSDELRKAEELLISSLTVEKIYSIQALGYLHSSQAFPLLVKMLPKAKGVSLVYIAQALWRIKKYEPAVPILCRILEKRGIFGSGATARRKAAIALGEINDERSIETLSLALNDKNDLVQYHAQRSLAKLLGMQEELSLLNQAKCGSYSERQSASKDFRRRLESKLDNYFKAR